MGGRERADAGPRARRFGRGPAAGLLLWLLAAGCGDAGAAPEPGLEISSVRPVRVIAGEPLEVLGSSLDGAAFALDDRPLEVVERSGRRVLLLAPDDLPPCPAPMPDASLVARDGTRRDSVDVEILGAPATVELAPSQHTVTPLPADCPLRFAAAGTYGVALFRTAGDAGSAVGPLDRSSLSLSLVATGELPLDDVGRSPGVGAGTPTGAAPRGGAPAREVGECSKDPLEVGDTLPLDSPYGTTDGTYEVVSTSRHYQVLAERDSLARYAGTRRARAEELAATLEAEVQPFLDRVFEAWPDLDGDDRLTLLLARGTGASFSGGQGYYRDGCVGDFLVIAHSLLDADFDATRNNPLGVVVHEATHWYDLGARLARAPRVPEWTVEATASLVERLWEWSARGRPFWEADELPCPSGATCQLDLMRGNRYGLGFSRQAGYGAGMHLLHYLLQQAVPAGQDPYAAAGMLRHRDSFPDDYRLRPLFEVMGGTGRTEAELQGEYLLSFYADEHVPGASPRIQQLSWRLPELSESYPLRRFTLGQGRSSASVSLGRPDGTVFEVVARAGHLLRLDRGLAGLTAAVVRAR